MSQLENYPKSQLTEYVNKNKIFKKKKLHVISDALKIKPWLHPWRVYLFCLVTYFVTEKTMPLH